MKPLAWMILAVGLASVLSAARAPKDSSDLMNRLDALWGTSAANFPKAAGLKPGDYQIVTASMPGSDKIEIAIGQAARTRWTPKSLASAVKSADFDPKLGLVEVSGLLKGTPPDFEALIKELNVRYGQYSMHNSAGETHAYGWVFPKATLSVTIGGNAPPTLRIQANP